MFEQFYFLCWLSFETVLHKLPLREKYPNTELFLGAYVLVFGLNLRIQSEYRKILARKISVFGHFSRSAHFSDVKHLLSVIKTALSNCIVVFVHTISGHITFIFLDSSLFGYFKYFRPETSPYQKHRHFVRLCYCVRYNQNLYIDIKRKTLAMTLIAHL